jgi:hypothetical protein
MFAKLMEKECLISMIFWKLPGREQIPLLTDRHSTAILDRQNQGHDLPFTSNRLNLFTLGKFNCRKGLEKSNDGVTGFRKRKIN